jgi:lactoylglutathione lyase
MDVIHTAVWVSDLEEATEFFVDGLGLERKRSAVIGGVENVWVGGETGGLQLRYADDHEFQRTDRAVIDHVAVSVDDVDAEVERLVEETGCAVLEEPRDGQTSSVRIAFIEGPDGYAVELVEDTS